MRFRRELITPSKGASSDCSTGGSFSPSTGPYSGGGGGGLAPNTKALRLAAGANSYLTRTASGAPIGGQNWLLISMWIYRHNVTDSFSNIIDLYNALKVVIKSTGRCEVNINTDEGTFSYQTNPASHDFATDLEDYFHLGVLYDGSITNNSIAVYHNGTAVAGFDPSTTEGNLVALSGNGICIGNRADNPTNANNADCDFYQTQIFGGSSASSGLLTNADCYNGGVPVNLSNSEYCILSINPDVAVTNDDIQGASYYTNNNTVVSTTNIPS